MKARSLVEPVAVTMLLCAIMSFVPLVSNERSIAHLGRAYAYADWMYDTIYIREGDNDYTVVVPTWILPEGPYLMCLYSDGEACGNEDHRTEKGDPRRYFCHFHIWYTLPKWGWNFYDPEHELEVTAAKIHAYWTNYYELLTGDYIPSGTVDHTTNCFAYSLGYDCWVENPSRIFADDYYPDEPSGYGPGMKDYQGSHIENIESVWTYLPDGPCESEYHKIRKTSEKYRRSAIYSIEYSKEREKGKEGILKVKKP